MNDYEKTLSEIKLTPEPLLEFFFKDETISLGIALPSKTNAKMLLKWREENWQWFGTRFEGSIDETLMWLENISHNTERLLLLIHVDEKPIGHLGIDIYDSKDKSVYLCDVLRGEKARAPGVVEPTLLAFLKWIFERLPVCSIKLRVFEDALPAIKLYEKCGFNVIAKYPCEKQIIKNGWRWVENLRLKGEAERYYLIMELVSE